MVKIMKKVLCVGAVATAAAFGTVGTAVAAPQTDTAVTSNVSVARSGTIGSRTAAVVPNVTPAVFSCSYVSLDPFRSFQFTCTIQSGTVQVYLLCSNGTRVNGPAMRAINTYYPLISCPIGTQATSILWQAL